MVDAVLEAGRSVIVIDYIHDHRRHPEQSTDYRDEVLGFRKLSFWSVVDWKNSEIRTVNSCFSG